MAPITYFAISASLCVCSLGVRQEFTHSGKIKMQKEATASDLTYVIANESTIVANASFLHSLGPQPHHRPTVCRTEEERDRFSRRFKLGKPDHDRKRPCTGEHSGRGAHFGYTKRGKENKIALYFYTGFRADPKGAFTVCSSKDRNGFCHRLYRQSRYRSVYFHRIESVEEAIRIVKRLDPSVKIEHLVLGGHGAVDALWWGPDRNESRSNHIKLKVGSRTTERFLRFVYPHLNIGGLHPSTVLLDACEAGKGGKHTKRGKKNLLLHVAHRLSGAKVMASMISFKGSELVITHGRYFDAEVHENNKGSNLMAKAQFGEQLRNWDFEAGQECADKRRYGRWQSGIGEIRECRERCEANKRRCKAFVWDPVGAPNHRCFLAKYCRYSVDNKRYMTFWRP